MNNLNLAGVKAAFVVYPHENAVCVSARSLGDVNVQLILEVLGGGGHATVAGARLETKDKDEAMEMVEKAIAKYMEENRKD